MVEQFSPAPTASDAVSVPVTTLTLDALETIRAHGAESSPTSAAAR